MEKGRECEGNKVGDVAEGEEQERRRRMRREKGRR